MLGHYLLSFYRALARHRLYAALNVLGLAAGIAVFLILWLDVRFETGFERWIPDADQIYVLRSKWLGAFQGPPSPATTGVMLDQLRADYPQLRGTRIWAVGGVVRQGPHLDGVDVNRVDPTFFQVFDLPLIAGDKATLLQQPDRLVLTRAKARQYFGVDKPIGRPLTLMFDGQSHVYRVAGVMKDPPLSTDFRFDIIVPLKAPTRDQDGGWYQWGDMQVATYLRLAGPGQAAALDMDLDRFADRHAGSDIAPPAHERLQLRTLPLTGLHLANPKDAAVIAGLGAVGVLTLLLAALNYVNLATARAGLRAREVAMRKVMGATRPALAAQFICEAFATVALAAVIGLALCELALPLVDAVGGLSLHMGYFGRDSVFPPIGLVIAAVSVGAGIYPAFVLSRFQPAPVLASARTPGGGRAGASVREALVVVQFAVAIAFTVATAVVVAQTVYLRQADLGFRRSGLIIVNSFDDSLVTAAQQANLLSAWRGLPDVLGATAGDIAPGVNDSTWSLNTKRPGQPGEGPSLNYVRSGPDFFQVYGARLIAGRLPDRARTGDFLPGPSPSDDPFRAPARNAVLNAAAVRALGFPDPEAAIGRRVLMGAQLNTFLPLQVIGVVADIRFRTPRQPIPPTIYLPVGGDIGNATAGLRYTGADSRAAMGRVRAVWGRIVPDVPFRAHTAEDNLQRYYRPDDQHGRLFVMGAALAVGIGCVGLYGLASFTVARRVKEIGIRKALGASTGDVLRLLVGQFLRPVLLANLAAWPLAWLSMRNWLSGFDQRIGLGLQYFAAATVLTLLVALATVAGQALAVARAEPARALRHE